MIEKKSFNIRVGERIRHAREKRDWTRDIFSEKCGLSISFLSDIERGIKSMSAENLKLIAYTLGVSVDSLLYDEVESKYNYISQKMEQLGPEQAKHLENIIREYLDAVNEN